MRWRLPAAARETTGAASTGFNQDGDLLRRNREYPAFDGLGSARAETNSSGTATATQDFDAFGNTIASSGSTSSPYNFAGDWAYQSDGDAGLQHAGARYYDPQVGRFASRDSMLDQMPYAYWGVSRQTSWIPADGRRLTGPLIFSAGLKLSPPSSAVAGEVQSAQRSAGGDGSLAGRGGGCSIRRLAQGLPWRTTRAPK
ncbi:MAG: hypothetical protein KGJ62_01215 [Armatimonadetes bacterium]|nr:hypothetical protein [Armatimonadota bacterium]MDE2207905.1 hypothetical protein [Armatimonadota bacterium]